MTDGTGTDTPAEPVDGVEPAEPDVERVDPDGAVLDRSADGPVLEQTAALPDQAGPFSTRIGRLTGFLTFAYVIAWMLRVSSLQAGLNDHRRIIAMSGSLGARVALAVGLVAALHHGLDGCRIVLVEWARSTRRFDPWFRAIVAFLTAALGLPCTVIILRPWIEGNLL